MKIKILETCSEDAHGSWEFWDNGDKKVEEKAVLITDAIQSLVEEGLVFATEYKFVKDATFTEVVLDRSRLEKEVKISIDTDNVNVTASYHFLATAKGEEVDIKWRS